MRRLPGRGLAALVLAAVAGAAPAAAGRPPNVILVLLDDLGWRDVGFMGNTFVETPHLDALAARGVVFTQAYASAPNCAPTRACLMSGQVTPRHGVYTVVDPRQPPGASWQQLLAAESRAELAPDVVTIPEALRTAGYATGFFGMWNLGRGRHGPATPAGQGFETVVFPETIGFAKDAYRDAQGRCLSDRLTDEVLAFVEAHRDRPFFAYLADHAVHAPFEPQPDLLARYEAKAAAGRDGRDDPAYAATIAAVDANVGRLVAALAALGLADDTLVIVTSDNGGTRRFTPPLRGAKGELYEGGIRVPLVIAGPGVAEPGTTSAVPVATVDLYPTLLALTGADPPAGQVLDGANLVPLLAGRAAPAPRALYWHFPCYVGRAPPASAVRAGPLKLVEFFEDGGRVELYDLAADPHETRDLAAARPADAAALAARLRDWQRATGAAPPRGANPAYDPAAGRPREHRPEGRTRGGGRRGGQPGRERK